MEGQVPVEDWSGYEILRFKCNHCDYVLFLAFTLRKHVNRQFCSKTFLPSKSVSAAPTHRSGRTGRSWGSGRADKIFPRRWRFSLPTCLPVACHSSQLSPSPSWLPIWCRGVFSSCRLRWKHITQVMGKIHWIKFPRLWSFKQGFYLWCHVTHLLVVLVASHKPDIGG